ncbi:hypothetical protein A2110_00085 [Candidatus Jorgensenbacteria bacterium GWA1_54_12]|uniref:ATP-cone domain-containing protein n=1 Tax=Candidatus Jorgensenbacteria bacterium GWA1_54_12 TaxID=1798468 RepID=A0A1F6BIY1_9BACT|nr:MAG: hypothetical protein A2110_00085 [Candidatus Jorgensenbacteria bacterium GWA1_54_12]
MARTVIKHDGTKEPFDADKVKKSVQMAAEDAGLEPDRVQDAVMRASQAALELAAGVEEIATSELRDKILEVLDNIEPTAGDSWRRYEETNK